MTEVTAVIEAREVTSVLQPVVRISSGEIIGYEALARGPAGTRWESPIELFCAATAIGRGAELDWICRARAIEAAMEAGLPRSAALFVNTEPTSAGTSCPADLRSLVAQAGRSIRVVLELTERAVSTEPAALLATAVATRRAGIGVGLDNVGGDPAVLALLSLAHPDVIKLDPYLLRTPLRAETAHMVEGINEYARRTGAVIAASGIETEQQCRIARSMGATIGQGWYFGPPARAAAGPAGPREPLRGSRPLAARSAAAHDPALTPYDIVTARRPVRQSPAAMLLAVTRRLEASALDPDNPVIVLSCLRQPGALSLDQWDWYAALGRHAAMLGVVGPGLAGTTLPGAAIADVGPTDRLCGEWHTIVVGPRSAGALVARAPVGAGRDPEDRLGYAITFDRELVLAAARSLLGRITA